MSINIVDMIAQFTRNYDSNGQMCPKNYKKYKKFYRVGHFKGFQVCARVLYVCLNLYNKQLKRCKILAKLRAVTSERYLLGSIMDFFLIFRINRDF